MILSSAYRAPPPMILVTLLASPPLTLSASSHTSSHHTFSTTQLCLSQCTPSIWFLPMMTFLSVAPGSRRNTASAFLPSFCPWHCTLERS
uniref:Secreted protein n=1 Tax=Globisporangium ultimum (strain ATCC 200006 / CBS 805.95 / DAOM BR144) TaxID=431595 RepID=K3W7W1_GLOUD